MQQVYSKVIVAHAADVYFYVEIFSSGFSLADGRAVKGATQQQPWKKACKITYYVSLNRRSGCEASVLALCESRFSSAPMYRLTVTLRDKIARHLHRDRRTLCPPPLRLWR